MDTTRQNKIAKLIQKELADIFLQDSIPVYNCMITDNSDITSCGVNWVDEDSKIIREDCLRQHSVLSGKEAMKELLCDKCAKAYERLLEEVKLGDTDG